MAQPIFTVGRQLTTDVEQAREGIRLRYGAGWNTGPLSGNDHIYRLTTRFAASPQINFILCDTAGHVSQCGDCSRLIFEIPVPPIGPQFRIGGRTYVPQVGRTALLVGPDTAIAASFAPTRGSHGASIDGMALAEHAAALFDLDSLPRWESAREIDLTQGAGALLSRLGGWICAELDQETGLFQSPMASRHATEAFLTTLLEAYWQEPRATLLPPKEISSSQLRLAEAYIVANAHRDITMRDVAKAAGASLRSIQLAFQRERQTTPRRFLMSCRLRHARTMLQSAPPGTSVAGIALESGFSNLGRFSARYRAEFGELPSVTMRRALQRAA